MHSVDHSERITRNLRAYRKVLLQRGAFLNDVATIHDLLGAFLFERLGPGPDEAEDERRESGPSDEWFLLLARLDTGPRIEIVLKILDREGLEAHATFKRELKWMQNQRNAIAHSSITVAFEEWGVGIGGPDGDYKQKRLRRGGDQVVTSAVLSGAQERLEEITRTALLVLLAARSSRVSGASLAEEFRKTVNVRYDGDTWSDDALSDISFLAPHEQRLGEAIEQSGEAD